MNSKTMKNKVRIILLLVTVFVFGCRNKLKPVDDKFFSKEEIVADDYIFAPRTANPRPGSFYLVSCMRVQTI